MQRVLFFTKQSVPTADEAQQISALKALVEQKYQVIVVNGSEKVVYGSNPAPADFVSGNVPDDFKDKPVFTEDAAKGLEDTQAIVSDKQTIVAADGGTITLGVVKGVLSATYAAKAG